MARLMLSSGMFAAFASAMIVRRRGLMSGIAAAIAGGDGQLFDEAREDLAALGVGGALLVLNRVPLGMAGHICSLRALKGSERGILAFGKAVQEAGPSGPAVMSYAARRRQACSIVFAGQEEFFERGRVRHGRVERAEDADRARRAYSNASS